MLEQGNTVEATLEIGVLGFQQRFRTRNTLQRPERIGIDLVSGPFRRLRGEWRFVPADVQGAEISLTLSFEVTLSPFGIVFAKVFEELAASQMGAFIDARQGDLRRRHLTGRSPSRRSVTFVQAGGCSARSRSTRVTRSFSKWTTTQRWIRSGERPRRK